MRSKGSEMKDPLITPVVLCGGSGKRLWPLSRRSMPKQFVSVLGQDSMLQATVRRLEESGCSSPILMTAQDYRFIVAEQIEAIGVSGHRIVIEPSARNTAPAIAAAVEVIDDDDALVLVVPSDHHFSDSMLLANAIAAGAECARAGQIVTFGIRPDRPETGYGYIEIVGSVDAFGSVAPFSRFIEKPDLARAQALISGRRHVWNSGIFLFTVRSMRAALQRHQPELLHLARDAVFHGQRDLDFLRLSDVFERAPNISIDYAVLEHETGSVVLLDAGWSDLGSWRSVWQETFKDPAGVGLVGPALAEGCSDTLLRSDDPGVQVLGIGLSNIAAVATRDAVLVCNLDATQSVGEAVRRLSEAGVKQAGEFPRHARPWGHFETLSLGSRFQVKSIVVKPGGMLSLQSHVHRAEHWVVVEGTALVTVGQTETLLSENQSIYIPLGEIHRLANPGKVPLRIIEVQTGVYLGEDDIVRYEDIYARG